jgi:arginyl-tRNA synthetase
MLLHKSETIIQEIKHILKKTISKLPTIVNETSNSLNDINVQVEKTKNLKFGDFSSNIMMVLGLSKDKVQLFAKIVADKLDKKFFKKVEVAGPGFLNLFLSDETINDYLQEISKEKDEYGKFKQKKLFYNIEFVSANPTGLLHIGHARNAAIGDTLANVWQTYGIDVNREYYVNDAGNQIEKLAMSVLIRYKQLLGMKDELPEDSYHGSEINDVAKAIVTDYKDKYKDVKCDQNKITDSNENVNFFKNFSKKFLLNIIKDTLTEFGVHMDI